MPNEKEPFHEFYEEKSILKIIKFIISVIKKYK